MRPSARRIARRALGRPVRPGLLESDRLALDPAVDLTGPQLERHHRALADQLARRAASGNEVRTVLWLIPAFDHAAYGGIATILRFADGFTRRHGAECRFHVYDASPGQELEVGERIATAFPALGGARVSGPPDLAGLPPCDLAIGTFWPTAFVLARLGQARSRMLFVQDRESAFYPAGAASALADQSLRLGFPMILNSPALAGLAAESAVPSIVFTPSVDTGLFHPAPARRAGAPFRVVLYARPSAMRNAFGLGIAALTQLKARHGERVELLTAGEEWAPRQFGLPEGVVRNVGLLPDLEAVAQLYRSCDAGLFFMMTPHTSYQPLELMASGAVCVSNENAATTWLLEHERTALLAPAVPALVADQVGRLVDDPALRARLVQAGLERVGALPAWDGEIDAVWGFATGQ